MKKVMSMTEVLSNISMCRKRIGTISTVLDGTSFPGLSNKYKPTFMSIANPMKDQDYFGYDKTDTEKSIQSNWDTIVANINNLIKYSMIKEQVNATHVITIPNPNPMDTTNKELTVTIAEALILNSTSIRNYYNSILAKLKTDYNKMAENMKNHNDTTLSEESISKYVSSVLNLQGGEKTSAKNIDLSKYSSYVEEYTKANKLEYIDPIKVNEKIEFYEKWIDDFYNTIGYRLSEFNSKLKVWVDLDINDGGFWGYNTQDEVVEN